jgi:hypothetical protein
VENARAQVMSVKDWIITFIITIIPFVNIIMLFVWAFSSNGNLNRANWAKAALLLFAISIILSILFSVIFGAGMFALFSGMEGSGM